MLEIYTDGSCIYNPGPGGWAYVFANCDAKLIAQCDECAHATNNQMEITAVLQALKATQEKDILIYSDSQYVVNAINSWLANWIKSDFNGKQNKELWLEYLRLSQGRNISAKWVKAHAGCELNELVDNLARLCARGNKFQALKICADLDRSFCQASKNSSSNSKFAQIEQKLNYQFRSDLIQRAMRHKSAGKLNNERLEFLGDAVMDLALAQMLFSDEAKYNEGDLSKLRAALVNEKSFAKIANWLNLGELLELSAAEERGGGRNKPSLLSDAFEAMMGVIYLEVGFDKAYEIACMLVNENFTHISTDLIKDYKTKLQELTQARWGIIPEYKVLSSSGPDHAKSFEIGLFLNSELKTNSIGKSKKEAEQSAAEKLYKSLI